MFEYRLRDSAGEIKEQAREIINSPVFSLLMGDIPSMIIIMNHRRQVIYMNREFSEAVNEKEKDENIGLRPGEYLHCIHAANSEYGCGSTDFCRVCGLFNAIEKTAKGRRTSGECNITLSHGETLTFRVYATPFKFKGHRYIFAYLQDISDFKTRQLLENIFLHDINNSVTALNGLNELMDDFSMEETKTIINELSTRLTDEIHSYRLITEAENHSLSVVVSRVDIDDLIGSIIKSMLNIRTFHHRKIEHKKTGLVINTDETLLRRVLINTIKNALEASTDNQEIKVYSNSGDNEKPGFFNINVRSYPLIPKDVQLQLFQRAYSTKSPGRGWGTYSIRLLTERYLGGRVSYVSNEKQRTLFTISIPHLNKND